MNARKLMMLVMCAFTLLTAPITTPIAFAADLTVNTANVEALSSATSVSLKVQAGEAIAPGKGVYKKVSDGKYYLASNDVDAASATAAGIAISGCSTDGFFVLVTSGEMDLGATLTPGHQYVVSATPGGLAAQGDLASTNYITSWGIAVAADKFIVNIKVTGYQKP